MQSNIYKERTSSRIAFVAIAIAVLGILLLVLSSTWEPLLESPELRSVVRDFGSLLIVSVAIAVVWELYARRAFVAELLAATNLADDIETTGLAGVSAKWHGEIDWRKLFASSDMFELLFSYGRTWRNTNRVYLSEFASRSNTKAKIALPDPENRPVVEELARRFETTPDELVNSIREAEKEFIDIFSVNGRADDKLEIWYISTAPVWSYYRFDGLTIFTLYKHRHGKLDVPTFIVKKGGTLYTFLTTEFDALTSANGQLGRRIFPPLEVNN